MQARRRAGLRSFPGGLLQNELVQRQIRDRLAQSAVFKLKVLQALHLLGLQAAKLLAKRKSTAILLCIGLRASRFDSLVKRRGSEDSITTG